MLTPTANVDTAWYRLLRLCVREPDGDSRGSPDTYVGTASPDQHVGSNMVIGPAHGRNPEILRLTRDRFNG